MDKPPAMDLENGSESGRIGPLGWGAIGEEEPGAEQADRLRESNDAEQRAGGNEAAGSANRESSMRGTTGDAPFRSGRHQAPGRADRLDPAAGADAMDDDAAGAEAPVADEAGAAEIATGAIVTDSDGRRVGSVRAAYPHYLAVEDDGPPPTAFRAPRQAIGASDAGSVTLTVPTEALDPMTPSGAAADPLPRHGDQPGAPH